MSAADAAVHRRDVTSLIGAPLEGLADGIGRHSLLNIGTDWPGESLPQLVGKVLPRNGSSSPFGRCSTNKVEI
ncbi:hypothetical protein H7K24_19300 [Mycobacterium fragae]|uniref:hypothetical protein n=1 Tax=Mycobacterium fragae TaxID=1260918 RepID=UPI00111C46EF|nr:hypothetical protein [Mycobacterium fragae]MCV7402287.1 hypothetical protein [Mycobacterium fragae]